jgi:acyl-CoA reductase-like NAD-dependent aldehyde dehydrogenase
LAKAADAFATGVIAGLDFDTYVELASRISGVPIAVTRSGARGVTDGVASAFGVVQLARPTGAVLDWRDERTRDGAAVWVRRGEVFAVLASGNGPGVHGLWPQALALGYRVAVRPSRREPLTAHRLVHALREAGFRPQDAVYLPTDHRGADEIMRSADLAMVYGSQDVVDLYANDPTVLVNGPGRAKILITADQDWRDYLDVITDSIANLGGIACVNTTAVLYEGDPTPLAQAIGERLSAIPVLPTEDERAILPTQNIDQATALAAYLAAVAAGTTPVLGADQVVAALTDGCAALRPAVHLMAKPDVAKLNIELPFPCVWVSPWSRSDGLDPLRHSLVINAITNDEDLIDDLLNDSTIANVYRGHHPTYYGEPEIPHDGFLPDFLMRNKGFIRD